MLSYKKFKLFKKKIKIEYNFIYTINELIKVIKTNKLKIVLIGGKTNTLPIYKKITKLKGVFNQYYTNKYDNLIYSGVGVPFSKITKEVIHLGWPDAIGWIGIPGTIGGALKMNAGTTLGTIWDIIEKIYILKNGKLNIIKRIDLSIKYREISTINDLIFLGVLFRINKKYLSKSILFNIKNRKYRKRTQPFEISLGSVFKNKKKIYSGKIIEQDKKKGSYIFGIQVSKKHANFFIRVGITSYKDSLFFILRIQKNIYEKYRVYLKSEIILR